MRMIVKIYFLIFMSIIGLTVQAQDTTNVRRQPPTPEQMAAFRKAMQERLRNDWAYLARYRDDNAKIGAPGPGEERVVFCGNSITDFWINIMPEFFAGKPYIDRGISGQTTPQMLVRFRQDVINLKPKVVVILAGINDINGNTGPSTLEMIEDNIRSMVEIAKANNIQVVLSSVLPCDSIYVRPDLHPAERVLLLNLWLKNYAGENQCVYLDYFPSLADEKNGLKEEYTNDGIHPNKAGYEVMAPLADEAVKKALSVSANNARNGPPRLNPNFQPPPRPTPADYENPTGSYGVVMEVDETLPNHSIYRPEDLKNFPGKDHLPIVIMSGPGCNTDGDFYRPFWTEIASHGYIVLAIGKPVGNGYFPRPWINTADDYLTALNWIFAENCRKDSKYFNKVDTSKVALFGQSCGGIQALRIADDPRVTTLVFWNSGSLLMGNIGPTDHTKRLNTTSDLMGNRDLKKILLSLNIPIAYFVGDTDMARQIALEDFNELENVPVFYAVREIPGDSHGGTYFHANGGAFGPVAVGWLNWITKGDKKASELFKGNPSPLTKDPKWIEIKKKNI
jgi:lysophospholipase L1-like esterase